jgi:hypothetical protein
MTSQINSEPKETQARGREFLKYTFFKIDQQWKLLRNKAKTGMKIRDILDLLG